MCGHLSAYTCVRVCICVMHACVCMFHFSELVWPSSIFGLVNAQSAAAKLNKTLPGRHQCVLRLVLVLSLPKLLPASSQEMSIDDPKTSFLLRVNEFQKADDLSCVDRIN